MTYVRGLLFFITIMNFNILVSTIQLTHSALQNSAIKSVNRYLTIRNWLIGFYIVEYEQKGEDRATYGKKILDNLAGILSIKGLTAPELSRCRQFYQTYPEILGLITQKSGDMHKELLFISSNIYAQNQILGLTTQELEDKDLKHISTIINNISYTHLTELIKIDEPLKRKFYELLILKTQPSVKELKRQINTLTYERLGLSGNTEHAFEQIQNKIIPASQTDIVKSHYFLEFLNFNKPGLVEESELEQEILNHLQEFILEMGNGFCFEARQKRILIGDEYGFIDLVFYHRILKCHILIDLKIDEFNHVDAGQLNTYLNYYKAKVMQPDDNLPVGILLVTNKNNAMVEYATSGLDNKLFVSKYLIKLPSKKQLEDFIKNEIKNNSSILS